MKLYKIGTYLIVVISLIVGCSSQAIDDDFEDTMTSQAEMETESDTFSQESLETIVEETTIQETTEEETEMAESTEVFEWVEFINEEKNFKLLVPSNWIVVDKERYGVLLRPTDETQTSFYVDVRTTTYADYTYDDFVDELMGDLMRIRSDCTFTEPETIQINDYPFVVMNYDDGGAYGLVYYYRAFFTANTLGYEMYYVADEEEIELYGQIMEDIALSFEFVQ